MKTEQLLHWLDLPPGPWPPDHRALLGLPRQGALSADQIEMQALAQMDKLRPHQIINPDLVTEGMTRLAQAMIALSEPASSSPSPSSPSRTPPPRAPKPEKTAEKAPERKRDKSPKPAAKPASRAVDPAAALVLDAGKSNDLPTAVPILPSVILDAEIVEPGSKFGQKPQPLSRAWVTSATLSSQFPEEPLPTPVRAVAIPLEPRPEPPEGLIYHPGDRRAAYAELVALRKLLLAWRELRPFLATPSETIRTPVQVFRYVQAIHSCRKALKHSPRESLLDERQQGVAALIEHPLSLSLFRQLLPGQRKDLAINWTMFQNVLDQRYKALRDSLNRTKPRRPGLVPIQQLKSLATENPEWKLALVVALSFLIGLLKIAMTSSTRMP